MCFVEIVCGVPFLIIVSELIGGSNLTVVPVTADPEAPKSPPPDDVLAFEPNRLDVPAFPVLLVLPKIEPPVCACVVEAPPNNERFAFVFWLLPNNELVLL